MDWGADEPERAKEVATPAVVTCQMKPDPSASHRFPSGPAVMAMGRLAGLVPTEKTETVPPGVTRHTFALLASEAHRFPSGPVTM